MGMGLETTETSILEIGAGVLVLGMALITGGVVGALLVRRKYGAVLPLGLILAAVALLLWWEPVTRVVVSFPLLLIGYTWLIAWWRASQQESD
jgi:predicted MFS family arabinose efflux permease